MTKQGNTFSFNRNFLPFARRERSVGIPTQYTRVNNGREMNKRGGRPITFYLTIFLMLTSAFLYYSNSSLKLELEFKTDEINDLNDAKLQKMAAIDAIQIELERTEEERNNLIDDLEAANESIETKNKQVEQLKIDLGQLESDNNVLESEQERLKDDKLVAENQLVDLNQLRQRVNELENLVEEDKDELQKKNEDISKLQKDLEDAEKLAAESADKSSAPAPKIISLEAKPVQPESFEPAPVEQESVENDEAVEEEEMQSTENEVSTQSAS
ncbi:unnamed protein product, partial [Oikopleura dioica]